MLLNKCKKEDESWRSAKKVESLSEKEQETQQKAAKQQQIAK